MLYDAKARKDGAVVETVLVDDDPKAADFTYSRAGSLPVQRNKVRTVVEYGPHIPTLCKLLEEGHFD